MTKILIIEDEAGIADTLLFPLRAEGYECHWVTLGNEALDMQTKSPFDLWILDVGLPDINGFDVCKALRKFSDIPVIFLTARDSEIDRIVGLEIGADDYIVKPFSPREVVARVRTILKRVQPSISALSGAPENEFEIDTSLYSIKLKGENLGLTHHEYSILSHMIMHPNQIFSRDQLLNTVGVQENCGYDRTIDTHIKSIRSKIRSISPEFEVIITHRGFGYSFNPKGE